MIDFGPPNRSLNAVYRVSADHINIFPIHITCKKNPQTLNPQFHLLTKALQSLAERENSRKSLLFSLKEC